MIFTSLQSGFEKAAVSPEQARLLITDTIGKAGMLRHILQSDLLTPGSYSADTSAQSICCAGIFADLLVKLVRHLHRIGVAGRVENCCAHSPTSALPNQLTKR